VDDVCDGVGTACVDAQAGTEVVCRAAAGACDEEERCDGQTVSCPTDEVSSSAVVCRAARFAAITS
jgi:hypothetical protein